MSAAEAMPRTPEPERQAPEATEIPEEQEVIIPPSWEDDDSKESLIDPVDIEQKANEKIASGSPFGKELLGEGGRLDEIRKKTDDLRPRGVWEKFTYFTGIDKRSADYKASKEQQVKTERRLGEWQKVQAEVIRQGEQFGILNDREIEERENISELETQAFEVDAAIFEFQQQMEAEGVSEEEINNARNQIAELSTRKLELIDQIRKSERTADYYRKEQQKLALKGHKDLRYLETKVLVELKTAAGIGADIPIEKGSGPLFSAEEEINDYVQKDKILSELDAIINNPSSKEAQHLIEVVMAKMKGAGSKSSEGSSEDNEEAEEGAENVAGEIDDTSNLLERAVLKMLRSEKPPLDAAHQEEFLKKEIGSSIRKAAESMARNRLVELKSQSRIDGMKEELKNYNPREAFDLIDKGILEEKREKAALIGIKKARGGYVLRQGWDKLVELNKKTAAKSLGVELRGVNEDGSDNEGMDVTYKTRLSDILKEGSNELAMIVQASGMLPAILNPARLATLAKTTETVESVISKPLELIFKRSHAIRKWRASLSERKNNTSRRVSDGIDAVIGVMNDLDVIRRKKNKKRQNNQSAGEPVLGGENA